MNWRCRGKKEDGRRKMEDGRWKMEDLKMGRLEDQEGALALLQLLVAFFKDSYQRTFAIVIKIVKFNASMRKIIHMESC
jgi:hypothetical protein